MYTMYIYVCTGRGGAEAGQDGSEAERCAQGNRGPISIFGSLFEVGNWSEDRDLR